MLLQLLEEMLTLIGGLIVVYFVYVLISRKDDKPSTDPPAMAHTALRELVERAVEEARKLPGLGPSEASGSTQEGRNIVEQSYEDLLATVILNKVIEKFQREQVDGNSNVLLGKPSSRTKCALSESELGLDEGVEEGSSSLEPLSQDECSSECSASHLRHARNHQEPLSLTIEERIEEVTTTYTSDEDRRDVDNEILSVRSTRRVPFPECGMDIIDPSQESSEDSQDEPDMPNAPVNLISPIESWEENWLFQRKRAQTQPDAVAMLVPNSSADFKALIGDKDAEDTSDLSECSSAQSDEEIEKELMEAINNVVPRSPKRSESDAENYLDRKTADRTDAGTSCTVGVATDFQAIQELPKGKDTTLDDKQHDARYSTSTSNGIGRDEASVKTSVAIVSGESSGNVRTETTDAKRTVEIDGLQNYEYPPNDNYSSDRSESKTKDDGETGATRTVNYTKMEGDFRETKERANDAKDCSKHSERNVQRTDSPINNMVPDSRTTNNRDTSETHPAFIASDVPKTPTSMPTRISIVEYGTDEVDKGKDFIVGNEKVLDSLEYAQKILIAVDDDADAELDIRKNNSSPTSSSCHKINFHVEEEAQQESEYTEHYDIATQRHLDSLTKTDASGGENDSVNYDETDQRTARTKTPFEDESKCREAVALAKAESASYPSTKESNANENSQLATPPRPGSIAEREHKKWENAPPIENNPYSEENIQRRLWERQYSRRSSDIPGVHAEFSKSNGAELDIVLEPKQPDITRFGRDYYINDSKVPCGDRTRRSTTSLSSRPSSSLSQRSNSTVAEQEQQVSFRLERFEEASLHGSLSRRSYRDPQASPNFAINPLLRLESNLDDNFTLAMISERCSMEKINGKSTDAIRSFVIDNVDRAHWMDIKSLDERLETPDAERKGCTEGSTIAKDSVDEEGQIFSNKAANDILGDFILRERSLDYEEPGECDLLFNGDAATIAKTNDFPRNISMNPLYDPRNEDATSAERTNVADRDSGMDSIESNDLDISKVKSEERDDCKRLSWMEDGSAGGKEEQILSVNGKRYWNTCTWKFHTFGGIRGSTGGYKNDDPEDLVQDETSNIDLSFGALEFANMKFQTFGGIKRNRSIDGRRIPSYRVVRLRPSLRNLKGFKTGTSSIEAVNTMCNLNDKETRLAAENVSSENLSSEYGESNYETTRDRVESDILEKNDWQSKENYEKGLNAAKSRNRSVYSNNEGSASINSRRKPRDKRRYNRSANTGIGEIALEDEWQDEDEEQVSNNQVEVITVHSSNTRSKTNQLFSTSMLKCRTNGKRQQRKISKKHRDTDILRSDELRENRSANVNNVNNVMMSKFLDDTSRRSKSRLSTDNDSISSLRASRNDVSLLRNENGRRNRLRRPHRSSKEDGSLKLEPPVVPEVIEKRFATLKELRNATSNRTARSDNRGDGIVDKKLRISSLSGVTIW